MWRRPDGRALIATADFFTPIVDDARTWGAIAAANAASDVYAMGGSPLFALNLVAWPREKLPLELLGEVLAGGHEVAERGGWVVAGGHTVDGVEPMYGQAVIGELAPGHEPLTNAGARRDQAVVLTKPLGTGLLATAVKRSATTAVAERGPLHVTYQAAVASMTRLNDVAARIAREAGASAATDVTGFGLLGHLSEVARASAVHVQVDTEAVPVLPGAWELLDGGFVPGGTVRNVEYVRPLVDGDPPNRTLTMLADAQTSGGLVFTCDPDAAGRAVTELLGTGHAASVIGRTTGGEPGRLTLRW